MFFAAALSLTLQLQRTSFDLLDPVSIEVVAHNASAKPISVVFPKPIEYEISILKDGVTIWTSPTAQPLGVTIPAHTRAVMPGSPVLAVYIWNSISNDGSAPAPGNYTVRARLLGATLQPEASLNVHFIDPVPVSALAKLNLGDEVTIAGTLDETKGLLTDSTASIPLMKRLTGASGIVAIRGYISQRPDRTRAFYIIRWAQIK
jgi:hypothetical protein